jgi:hypothetical protein
MNTKYWREKKLLMEYHFSVTRGKRKSGIGNLLEEKSSLLSCGFVK